MTVSSSDGVVFSNRYRRYALIVISLVYMLNLVDRSLVAILLQSIKVDLGLSDTQLGFLTGLAFALFYSTLGVPIARLADRGNRATLASVAIALWGMTVMSSVLVGNYAQLLASRVLAAVGEAGCKPPTYSLIGDYFPEPKERTGAMSVYWLGSPIAALLSFIAGGALSEHIGWRLTFLVMGIPGLILALLVKWTIKDPWRLAAARDVKNAGQSVPLRSILLCLWRVTSLRHLTLALVLLYAMGVGLAPWYAAFMIRTHHLETGALGVWLGLIFGVGGILGNLAGGYASARFFAQNERRQMQMAAISVAAILPCLIGFLTLSSTTAAFSCLFPFIVLLNVFLAPTYVLLQRLVSEETRATTLAIIMLLANLIGMGLGPQIVGVLSDRLAGVAGSESLRYSMLAMSLLALWASYHFWCVSRTVTGDLAKMPTAIIP